VRLLLDSCVWGGAAAALRSAGHEVDWVGAWPADPGDAEILRHAQVDGWVLVTLDRDFGELVVVRGLPHAGLIRLVGFGAREQAPAVLWVLAQFAEAVDRRAIITVDPHRVRVRDPGA